MQDSLTDEQREMLTQQARTIAYSRAVIQMVQPLSGMEALSVLATSLTAIIGLSVPPKGRLPLLNAVLSTTIEAWAEEADTQVSTHQ